MSGIIGGAGSKSGVIGETELDYEEGTWTVTVGGATASLGNTVGYYTKIGKMVFYRWYSSATTFSSSSGKCRATLIIPSELDSTSPKKSLISLDTGETWTGGSLDMYMSMVNKSSS